MLIGWLEAGFDRERLTEGVRICREDRGITGKIAPDYLDQVLRDPKNWQPRKGGGDDVFARSMANTANWRPPEDEPALADGKAAA
jgi:hypothetical protein